MIPTNITRELVIKALEEIDANTIPQGRKSTKFALVFNGRWYPPKYVISLANKYANNRELKPSEFGGGQETNSFLKGLGFKIAESPLSEPDRHGGLIHDEKEDNGKNRTWHDTPRHFLRESKEWVATIVLQSNFLSIDAEFEDDLNNVSEKLKDAFKTEEISISENARVTKEKDDKWVITDGEKSYIVKKEEGKLNIYKYSNEERMNVLSKVVESILKNSSGDGVILFPAGMFSTGEEETRTFYNEVEEIVKNILSKIERNIVVCTGIDGSVDEEGYSNDQIGIAVSKNGIDAIGRKFYPADQEKKHVKCAESHSSEEDGKSRIFELNRVKYFMCVCYDIFGIRHKELFNPEGVDVVLNLVHCFYPKGEGPAGESYFARHGFAGASKQWGCPVFGAVVFFNRGIPERWPSGVYWNQGDKGTPNWKYEDNPLKCTREFKVDISEGIALVRIFC
ncbi:MAG: hypothetical protein WBC40_04415 [Halobacteriota archaeon]